MTTVWYDRAVLDDLTSDIASWRRWIETGGPLFGYLSGSDVVVTHALAVGIRSRRRRSSFEPDPREVTALVKNVHDVSDGRLRYVGSWHTHPGGDPTPSPTDQAALLRLSRDEVLTLPQPTLLVAATRLSPWRSRIRDLVAWRVTPTGELIQASAEVADLGDDVRRLLRDRTVPPL